MTRITTDIYQTLRACIVKNRRTVVTLIHLLQVAIANYAAFLVRFEFSIPFNYLNQFIKYLPLLLVIRLIFYLQSGLYKNLWRYSSVNDLIQILKSATLGSVVFLLVVRYAFGDTHYPRSIYFLDLLILIMLSGGSRLFVRVFREYLQPGSSGKRILLIGAGDAGQMIVREMKNNPKYQFVPIGFIDDDPYKKGLSIHGVPIFGPKTIIKEVIEKHKPEEILISLPSASHKTLNEIYGICKPLNITVKTLPGLNYILDGKVSVSQIRPLSLEDLLMRDVVKTDIDAVKRYIEGKSVLVTGAGGSIGSELSRQIFEYKPSNLILFDRYENGLFDIDMELQGKVRSKQLGVSGSPHSSSLPTGQAGFTHSLAPVIATVVGDMRDIDTLEYMFSKHKPQIVFHAAAHKHVPLMENNPFEAVKNNIFGTKNLIDAAARHNAENFVMVSTDKAVNPTNIMGATKRVAELLTTCMNSSCTTKFTTVRFGNVLGSNGSVVHVFKDQLKRGGPLTVTHPDIKRFFMLIPEAVQLVLIAASSGKGGDILVLDMGEQITIRDLAENVIRLSGFVPHEDIQIEFTGLRPGEKMFEELFDEFEMMLPATHEKLRIAVPDKVPSISELEQSISVLGHIASNGSIDELMMEIQKLVPNFKRQTERSS